MYDIHNIETARQIIQENLDKLKSQEERNILGQFSTPNTLAVEILNHSKNLFQDFGKISFLDPAIGTGSFYSALCQVFNLNEVKKATGYEIDTHYGNPSQELWSTTPLNYRIGDFTLQDFPTKNQDKYDLIVCNPPYVRHHHLKGHKERLKNKSLQASNMSLSGLSGLYCYFMGIAHGWMKPGGIAVWLVPSEFMDVNYGVELKKYLLEEVTLIQVHRFNPDDLQFKDALVSSSIVWFKNQKPNGANRIKFTYGNSPSIPEIEKVIESKVLLKEAKWTRFPRLEVKILNNEPKLGDYFTIKRGIATGDNKFFILTKEEIERRELPLSEFQPILPSPRYLIDCSVVETTDSGHPLLSNQLFVLNSSLSFEQIKTQFPNLAQYLSDGIKNGVNDRYLCKNRKIWYSQEIRQPSLFYCTYVGRSDNKNKKPFRFIFNKSLAIVNNSYLILYPKSQLLDLINTYKGIGTLLIKVLNNITSNQMLEEGRVYGGGMHKMEPGELSKVDAKGIREIVDHLNNNSNLTNVFNYSEIVDDLTNNLTVSEKSKV